MNKGMITLAPEKTPPPIPMDYNWARELKLIRKPANFMTTISDERGEELLYAGMPISDVFKVQTVLSSYTLLVVHRMILVLVGCLVYCGSKEGRLCLKFRPCDHLITSHYCSTDCQIMHANFWRCV